MGSTHIIRQQKRQRLSAVTYIRLQGGEDVFKPVQVLSGGEQSRLRLCMLMDDEINFLILDEPTNHLDIASREWIEEAVEAYDGTLLFVSHDRYFINRFATRIWELSNGTITDYPMGFTQYRQVKAQEEKEPEKVEAQLRKILPPEESSDFCHRIVLFGRDCCTARNPKCGECPLAVHCTQFNP